MTNSRREFLSLAGYTFLFSSFPSIARASTKKRILILVELQGANDGLNTVIPLNQDYYYRLRPTIGIEKNRILNISKENGLHYSLKNIAKNYENGNVKIIQNLGYPHAVLSHFRSIDIWETGGDGKKQYRNGWLVDTLNNYNRNLDLDAKAMFLDNSNSIFRGGLDGFIGPNAVGLVSRFLSTTTGTYPFFSNCLQRCVPIYPLPPTTRTDLDMCFVSVLKISISFCIKVLI